MRECRVTDFFDLDGATKRVKDEDGFLRVPGVIAKGGNVQRYTAGELDLPGDPNRIVALYRPMDEVAKAAPTFARKPITNGHPKGRWVSPDNWMGLGVGDSGETVTMDGDRMVSDLLFRDAASIRDLESGKVGLSNGYKFRFDDTKTTTPDGLAVDGWMTDIVGNHIALVSRGRGGPECVVADHDKGKSMEKRRIGNDEFELDPKVAVAIDGLLADQKTAVGLASSAEQRAVSAEAEVKTHLAKIATMDAEIVALKKAPPAEPSAETIEKAAEARVSVCADAAILAPELKPAGKSPDAIRRDALTQATATDGDVKSVVDSILAGVAIEKADAGKVDSAFLAAVSLARKTATAEDSGLGRALLGGGGTDEQKDKSKGHQAADAEAGLSGRALYCQRLTQKARATA
jgi:hypothetical protein